MFANLKDTKKLVLTAMLAALAFVLSLIEIPTPFQSYLSIDASEIPVLIAANFFGSGGLIIVVILRSLFRFFFKGTLIFGEIAAICASIILGLIFTYINKKMSKNSEIKNNNITKILGIISSVFCIIAIIILATSNFDWKIMGIIVFSLPLLLLFILLIRPSKQLKLYFVQTIISSIVVTVIMVILNFIFITPSNALQKFAFYPEIVELWFNGSIKQYIYVTIIPLVPFNIFKIIIMIWLYFSVERVIKFSKTKTN
ncbi:MAG: ECF transporter S component [Bacilli bacterium]|nr:ECF transporter S component [Bacilli bacterium]